MGVLVREVAALYAAAVAGSPSPLAELPIQYADFTLWQRGRLSGERLAGEIDHWRQRLAGLADFELPADRPRPPVASARGGVRRFVVPGELVRTLESLGRSGGATLFMTLFASWSALLSRLAGRDDVAVGTAVAGRNRPEIEGLIGFFVNTLVLRLSCAGGPSFGELISRARQAALDAFAHQDLPFEKLVEELRPQRDLSRTPLFQLMFALQDGRQGRLELPGLEVEPIEPIEASEPGEFGADDETDAKFDLSLSFAATADGLVGSWVYRRQLFDAATVARMSAQLLALLGGLAGSPAVASTELSLLGEAERQQLLVEWSGWAAVAGVSPGLVPDLVAARAAAHPEAVAVSFAGADLSYGELSRRAAAVARRLRGLGVGAESRVGLLAPRSADLLAAILGIWGAGGAYVPLDALCRSSAWPSWWRTRSAPRGRRSCWLRAASVSWSRRCRSPASRWCSWMSCWRRRARPERRRAAPGEPTSSRRSWPT